MNVVDGYDSDEEFSFNPCSQDWIPEDPLLQNTKQLREDYCLLNCIGHGSYSAVYKVENCKTHEILCAKNFYPEIVDRDRIPYEYYEISNHGKQEIQNLLEIQHPSIPSILGIYRGRRRGSVYIIMELYDTNLDELLRCENILSINDIKSITYELLSILSYIHEKHLIHCDVKLSNILYKQGKIALCDWGEISSFSLSLGSACSSHSVGTLPTLAYRSPEMLLWKKDMNSTLWTEGIDIWSWGIILLELLAKHYVYQGESELAAINMTIRLVGNDNLDKEEDAMFQELCENCHLHFPSFHSTLEEWIHKEMPQEVISDSFIRMLQGSLHCMPMNRSTAKELMQAAWWKEEPITRPVTSLPDYSITLQQIREEKKKKALEMWMQLQNSLL